MADLIDKRGLLDSPPGDLRLDIGCGNHKRGPEWTGLDILDLPPVDLVGDVLEVLARLPDAAVTGVFTSHFLEHVAPLEQVLAEIARVLRPGGTLEVVVPHFSNPFFWSDPTHRRAFGLYTFTYLAQNDLYEREVPDYGDRLPLRVTDQHVAFRQDPGYAVRARVMQAIEAAVNGSRGRQAFWEANLVWVLPCFELRITLEK